MTAENHAHFMLVYGTPTAPSLSSLAMSLHFYILYKVQYMYINASQLKWTFHVPVTFIEYQYVGFTAQAENIISQS
jgi:hypothetical protein